MELLTQLMKVPSAALCLFALFFLLVALLKIKQVRLSVSMAASSGLMLAMAVILTAFPFYRMPNGGSVTLGGMLPLFFHKLCLWTGSGHAGRFCLQSHEPCDGTIYPASCSGPFRLSPAFYGLGSCRLFPSAPHGRHHGRRGGTAFFPFSFGRGLFWQLRSGRHFDLSLFLCDQPDLSFAKPCNLSCLLPAPSRGALPFPHETVRGGRETILQKLFWS